MTTMSTILTSIAQEYEEALHDHLAGGGESALQRAYELGRRAVTEGLGVLDLARMYQDALFRALHGNSAAPPRGESERIEAASHFFIESLSPFEMTHRGFQELINTLSRHTLDLAKLNKDLQAEIAKRRHAKDELERSLSLLRATLDATADGILVIHRNGTIESFNQRFLEMWHLEHSAMESNDAVQVLSTVLSQVALPEEFLTEIRRLNEQPETESFDCIQVQDGRVIERSSKPQRIGGKSVGRVWSFRDVTARKRAEETLRALAESIVRLQEEERQRVSRELHDDICQRLSATKLHLELFADDLPRQSATLMQKLQEIKNQITSTIAEVRRISSNLRPTALDDFGLVIAIQHLCAEFESLLNIRIRFITNGAAHERRHPHLDIALYRIVQEALSNIAKHANASAVSVELFHPHAELVALTIEDNGKGFEPEHIQHHQQTHHGMGLLSMRERTELLGGTFRIESAPGHGTRIYVELPLSQ